MRVGILTSGGDAPGMNAAVRAFVRRGWELGLEPIGIRRGYAGLIEGDMAPLTPRDVGGVIEYGGTFLRTARCPAFLTPEGRRKALDVLAREGLEALVVVGGEGSLQGAKWLARQGVKVVGLPASIDNDIAGTDMAIGVDTALNTVVWALNRIRDTALAHERVFLVEVMGRKSGYIALMGGIAGGAEIVLVPEVEVELDQVAEEISAGYRKGKHHSIVVVAEGVTERLGPTGELANFIRERTGLEVRVTVLGHLQRGGSPTAYDRILGSRLGAKAAEDAAAGRFGHMVAVRGGGLSPVPLSEVGRKELAIDLELYELAHSLGK
ncbi:6-phosphofructokinase [Candidatus Bipolaricaulota bacterium]|nr:6-phosphofructokinase [Candidatus Bipolaricaulota bacterium]